MTTLPFLALLSRHASEALQFLYRSLFLKSLPSFLAAKAKAASLGSSVFLYPKSRWVSLSPRTNAQSFALCFFFPFFPLQRWRRKRESVVIDESLQSPTVRVTEDRQLSSLKVVLPSSC